MKAHGPRRRRQDKHFLDQDGMGACNPRDREASHRAEVESMPKENPQAVTHKMKRQNR
jgi:hypothetical protein